MFIAATITRLLLITAQNPHTSITSLLLITAKNTSPTTIISHILAHDGYEYVVEEIHHLQLGCRDFISFYGAGVEVGMSIRILVPMESNLFYRNVFNLPSIRYNSGINTSPSTSGAYEAIALNVTMMLEPLLFKNLTERLGDVQENLLNVFEERSQELEGKVVRQMDKKLEDLGSQLRGALEKQMDKKIERMGERLTRTLEETIDKKMQKMEKKIDEKVERVEQSLMGEMQKMEKLEQRMEKLEQKMEKLEQKMESMEAQLNNRLDIIAAELRRTISDQQQPKNKTVEDTSSAGSGKSSVTVKDSELGGTMDDDMILKLLPALVAIILVLTMYKLEWVPRRERRWKIRDEAAETGKKRTGETGNLACNIM